MAKSCDKCDFTTEEAGVEVCPNDGEKLRHFYGDEGERVGIDVQCNFSASELADMYDLSVSQARKIKSLFRGLCVLIEFVDGKPKIVGFEED